MTLFQYDDPRGLSFVGHSPTQIKSAVLSYARKSHVQTPIPTEQEIARKEEVTLSFVRRSSTLGDTVRMNVTPHVSLEVNANAFDLAREQFSGTDLELIRHSDLYQLRSGLPHKTWFVPRDIVYAARDLDWEAHIPTIQHYLQSTRSRKLPDLRVLSNPVGYKAASTGK